VGLGPTSSRLRFPLADQPNDLVTRPAVEEAQVDQDRGVHQDQEDPAAHQWQHEPGMGSYLNI
jgi:hypothetical protein